MAKKRKDKTDQEQSIEQVKSLLTQNKGVALSFALALALSNFGVLPGIQAAGQMSNKTVLEKEKEKDQTQAEREWQEDEEQGYGSYNPGYGYYYRPYMWSGTSSRSSWVSQGSKKSSSVGGYHISKGSASG